MAAPVSRDRVVLDKSDPRTLNDGNTLEQLDNVECLIEEPGVTAVFAMVHVSGLVDTPTVILRLVVDPLNTGSFTIVKGTGAMTTAGLHTFGIGASAVGMNDCSDVITLPIPARFGVQFLMTGPSASDEMVIDWVNIWVT